VGNSLEGGGGKSELNHPQGSPTGKRGKGFRERIGERSADSIEGGAHGGREVLCNGKKPYLRSRVFNSNHIRKGPRGDSFYPKRQDAENIGEGEKTRDGEESC